MWIAYMNLAGAIVLLIFLMWASCYLITMASSLLFGAPYVATQLDELDNVLDRVSIPKGSTFIDLGCGDGRVVRHMIKKYELYSIGIDINPFLIILGRWRSRTLPPGTHEYINGSIEHAPLTRCDVIYLFLFPKLIDKLKLSFIHGLKPGTIVISHGFQVPYLHHHLVEKVQGDPFNTYIYKV